MVRRITATTEAPVSVRARVAPSGRPAYGDLESTGICSVTSPMPSVRTASSGVGSSNRASPAASSASSGTDIPHASGSSAS